MLANAPPPARTRTARWLDAESSRLVRSFWAAAGGEEPFPRSLERPMLLALPISIVKLASLHLHQADQWLRARGVGMRFTGDGRTDATDRPVHGCIVARSGHAFLFVDGADSPEDLRFTIAHEIGHFLADHWLPRTTAVDRFGTGILDVMDGKREPTMAERVSSLLRGVELQGTTSFLPRSESADGGLELWKVEGRADRIGAALLAPPERVLAAARAPTHAERLARAIDALTTTYGFPPAPAARYAQTLLEQNGQGRSWVEGLKRPFAQ
jgi:hypothetical protein